QDITPAPVASHDMHAAALSLGGTHFSGNNVASQSAIGTGEKHAYPSEYEYGSALFSWTQLAFAGLLITAGGWTFVRSRQPQVQNIQDWVFSKLWSAMSEQSAERVEEFRKPLWQQAHGNVLEIGIGHGEGLMLLPRTQSDESPKVQGITSYVAIEPNTFLHAKLVENAAKAGFSVNFDAETCPDAAPNAADSELPTLTIVNGTLDGGPNAIPSFVREHAPYDCILVSMVFCS
ncbi:hypothetical protein IW136_006569, partial [Coemansia sp. RSA 678]